MARGSDIPNACGPVDFLFRAGTRRLGIALECPDGERLVGYTSATRTYEVLQDITAAAEVTVQSDVRAGYRSGGTNGCWNVARFGDATGVDLGATSTAGDCGGTGSAKSPHLLADGDLVYLATDAAPAGQPVRDDMRGWHLHVAGAGSTRTVGPELVSFPEMDVSADGTTAIVALTTKDGGRLVSVDLEVGLPHQAHDGGEQPAELRQASPQPAVGAASRTATFAWFSWKLCSETRVSRAEA